VAEALDVDLEAVGVEADGHVELEAGGDGGGGRGDVAGLEGDEAAGVVDRVGGGRRLHDASNGNEDGAGDWSVVSGQWPVVPTSPRALPSISPLTI
jgi:hypothetical protein